MDVEDKTSYSPFEIDQIGANGTLRDALDFALREIRAGKRDGGLFYVAAKMAYELNDLSKSEQLVNHLLALDPEQLNGWLLLGKICQRRGDAARYNYAIGRIEEIFPAIEELNLHDKFGILDLKDGRYNDGNGDDARSPNIETETYADICVKQGYFNKALKIYTELRGYDSENDQLNRKIEELKKKMEKNE